jgi:RNA polymerase sigma factor (sigma-70 family)
MRSSTLAAGIRHLRDRLALQHRNADGDEHLLRAFLDGRDEAAFAALVHRHGPMVLHVCRRVLGHHQDAEDAFQATFLVLARNAAGLRDKTALASWLHGTAYRTAMKAKQSAARRRKHEGSLGALTQPRSPASPSDELSWREVRALLDEEIVRLPEIYRSVFVLCGLENLGRKEAAERLGLKERTVLSRLAEARKRLSKRLGRRGVELTAVLAAAALVTSPASGMPAGLLATTIKAVLATAAGKELAGIVSASVVKLVQGATSAVTVSKAKIATLLFLTASLLAGAGAWTCRTLATPQLSEPKAEAPAPPSRPAQARQTESPRQEKDKGVRVCGRVLGPDGKPVKGARLFWPRLPKTEPRTVEEIENIEIPQRGQTDGEGRFRFELPRSDINPDWNLALIAAADGYGVAWAEWPTLKKGGELTLRLVKDQPIEGRIVSSEGKPVAGVRVNIATLGAMREGKVDAFLSAWKREWQTAWHEHTERVYWPVTDVPSAAMTDKDGHFRIAGAGAERLVILRMRGPGITQQVFVINRAGFDAALVNKAVLDRIPAELRQPGQPPLLYGPKLTYVVPASRCIEGTVREAGSGKPVAGYVIGIILGYDFGIDAVSDKHGRYRLNGVPKVKQYLLGAEPPAGTSWLRTGARLDDTQGVQPLTVDFTVARGIVLSGRVLDKTTGKGVEGGIRFVPLPGNPFTDKPGYDSYKYERLTTQVDSAGRFKFTVIPGPGVLMVQAHGVERTNGGREVIPYKLAEFDAKDRERVKITVNEDGDRYFTTLDNSLEFLNLHHAVKVLDLAADAGAATCNLFVERGQTRTVKIEDADGKPLKGTTVAGVMAHLPSPMTIQDTDCTVFALDPKKPRRLLFFHADRNLAGSLTVRGDERESPVARLRPTGSVTGRVLDRDGQPIAGADIILSSPDAAARELYRQMDLRREVVHTDKEGRFHIEGIVPEVKFTLTVYQGRTFLVGEPRIGARQVKPGETLDLGDRRVKPAR